MSGQLPLREFTIDTPEGNTVGACLWGDPEGAPLFWLHGTPGSRMLRHDVDDYRARRLYVCTYDRPGYGLSTRKPGRTVADAADDVGLLADALGWETFGVAGVSNGGPPALAAAAKMPDR